MPGIQIQVDNRSKSWMSGTSNTHNLLRGQRLLWYKLFLWLGTYPDYKQDFDICWVCYSAKQSGQNRRTDFKKFRHVRNIQDTLFILTIVSVSYSGHFYLPLHILMTLKNVYVYSKSLLLLSYYWKLWCKKFFHTLPSSLLFIYRENKSGRTTATVILFWSYQL